MAKNTTTNSRSPRPTRRSSQRGNAMIEFGLAMAFVAPLMMSTFSFALNMTKAIQVAQVVRDAGHMYARSTDFSTTGNKRILVRLAQGLGMTEDGGDAVVILSKISKIENADCVAAGLSTGDCVNKDHYVIVQRQVVGNALYHASKYCSPPNASLELPEGNALDVLRDNNLQMVNTGDLPTLRTGQYAYVVEGFFRGTGWAVPDVGLGNLIASRAIF